MTVLSKGRVRPSISKDTLLGRHAVFCVLASSHWNIICDRSHAVEW